MPPLCELLDASESSEITFDPNIRPALLDRRAAVPVFEELTRLSTVVKMSDEDADWLYPDVDLNQVIDQVLSLGTRLAVITRGATGAVLATQHDRIHMGAESVTVVDTIGAGDSFMSSLILSILEVGSSDLKKQDLVTMGKAASRVAAITVSRAGADLPGPTRSPSAQLLAPGAGSALTLGTVAYDQCAPYA